MSEIHLPAHYEQSLQHELRESIAQWHADVSKLLWTLPAEITIDFDDNYLSPGFGTGGVAFSPDTIKLAYDPNFDATHDKLVAKLRATYFHECYHLARGFSYETTPANLSALHNAVEEGLATKFEVIHAGSKPGYEQYEDRETMLDWLEEVRSLPDGFDYDWERWKFLDPDTGRKWILYKVGTFLVDEALKNNPDLTIESMSTLPIADIVELSKR